MAQPLENAKKAIERRVGEATHKATERFNTEIEEIIYKAIASEEMEAIIARAIENVILSLGRRYWRLLVTLVLILLGIQSIFLSITLTTLTHVI